MRIGVGTTVWAKGAQSGHLDGIGVYTREIWKSLLHCAESQEQEFHFTPFAFGRDMPTLACGRPQVIADHYSAYALRAAAIGPSRSISAAIGDQVDLFHATDHHIPQLKGVPVVANVMDLIPMIHPEWASSTLRRTKNWLFSKTIRSADHLITISEFSKRDLIEHLSIAPERISVTPLGVGAEYFEETPAAQRHQTLAELGLKPGFFLFVGTLQPRKNLQRVIDAHRLLPATLRKEHPLIIVGRTGWKSDELLESLRQLETRGEGRRFEYLPGTTVRALLQSAAALVFPSLYEGFGLPVVEAFASRCPVITSSTTSLPEVAGDAALLVDPTQADAIAAAMLELLEQPEQAARRVDLGQQRAVDYSWEACARRTLDVYRRIGGR
ncbi:glycosyltransferase family 4 protein [Pseudomonas sp. YH-1]|uniref:glycosyltransferase family 4 protein n=1 Tax=Pseudomonas sp. YH-1 TaxID=3384787 RepID=UPI003F7CF91F